MHVTGLSEFPAGGQPAPALSIPSWFENQQAPAVGELLRGTRTGVDAAAILLRPSVQSVNRAPVVGALRGWRPIVHPDDLTTPVQLYGAVSRYREGRIRYTHVSIPEDRLQHAVLAEIQTAHGDSGAALVDPAGLILGFLFGLAPAQFGPLAVFSSAGGVLKRLGCDIPSS